MTDSNATKESPPETLGKAGGKARAEKLTPERRRAIAQAAAIARWAIKEVKPSSSS